MQKLVLAVFTVCIFPTTTFGEVVVAARTIRSHSILTAEDLIIQKTRPNDAVVNLSDYIGLETRVVLYEGRPVSLSDVGPAAVIERNQIVKIVFVQGAIQISAEGRSLSRAGIGEGVKVMNLDSRNTVFGIASENGSIVVRGGNFSN